MLLKDKNKIRNWAKDERKGLDLSRISDFIVGNITSCEVFKRSKNVMLYHPMQNEISLLALLENKKDFFFPKIVNDKIISFASGKAYTKGAYGIMEPFETEEIDPREIDLILVPALAVDKNGNRIGYGKGYYDKFLAQIDKNKTKTMAAVPEVLFVEKIEAEAFDIPLDYLATEKIIYKF